MRKPLPAVLKALARDITAGLELRHTVLPKSQAVGVVYSSKSVMTDLDPFLHMKRKCSWWRSDFTWVREPKKAI